MSVSAGSKEVLPVLVENEAIENQVYDDPRIQHFVAVSSRFTACEFRRLRISQGSFGGGFGTSSYKNCVFDACDIRMIAPGRATFVGCHFRDIRLVGWICHEVEFVDCSFSGQMKRMIFNAALSSRDRSSLSRERNRYENNDFRQCRFEDVSFRGGILLMPELLPTDPGGVFIPNSGVIQSALADLRQRSGVKGLNYAIDRLEIAMLHAEGGQEQFYYSSADLEHKSTEKAAGCSLLREVLEKRLQRMSRGTSIGRDGDAEDLPGGKVLGAD